VTHSEFVMSIYFQI